MPSTVGIVASHYSGFSPLSLSPALWLDASDATTITASGGKVSQWNDKSANGLVFTQSTSARQPSTGLSTQNGRNVMTFGATWLSDYNAARWKPLSDGTKYIIAVAWRNTSIVATNMLLGNSQANPNTRGMWFRRSSTSNLQHLVWNNSATAQPIDNVTANGTGNATVSTVLADPSNSTAASRSFIATDSQSTVGNNAKTGSASSLDPNYIFCVGSSSYTSTDQGGGFYGWIAELVIVTGANATEANRVLLRDYLNTKWAVY